MASATVEHVKDSVKESLLGTEEHEQGTEPKASSQTRTAFLKHATKDPETGDLFMDELGFVDAIAPPTEDYVRSICE